MQVLLCVESAKLSGLKRVLEAGGAEVFLHRYVVHYSDSVLFLISSDTATQLLLHQVVSHKPL